MNVKDCKDFVVTTNETVKRGIFFCNPIQEVQLDFWLDEDDTMSAYKYLDSLNNPIRRAFERLIGNGIVVKNRNNYFEDDDTIGILVKVLCCPIRFERNYRMLNAISMDSKTNIVSIKSIGYENPFEQVAGNCCKEKTKIKLRNGKTIKFTEKETYKYTYEHVVSEMLKERAL